MKITQSKLKQIIKEELEATLNEVPSAQIAAMRNTQRNVKAQSPEAKKKAAAEKAAMMQRYKEDEERRAAEEARLKTCEELYEEYESYAGGDATDAARNPFYWDDVEDSKKVLQKAASGEGVKGGEPCPWAVKLTQPAEKPSADRMTSQQRYGFELKETKMTKSKLIQVIREEIVNTLAELDESVSAGIRRRLRNRRQARRKEDAARRKSPDTKSSSTPRTTDTGATPPSRTAAPSNVPQQKPLTPEEFDAIIAKHWANIGRNKEKDTSKEGK